MHAISTVPPRPPLPKTIMHLENDGGNRRVEQKRHGQGNRGVLVLNATHHAVLGLGVRRARGHAVSGHRINSLTSRVSGRRDQSVLLAENSGARKSARAGGGESGG